MLQAPFDRATENHLLTYIHLRVREDNARAIRL
ncbi:MAG TPA: hypothetical protein DCG12_08465 [Planctomycetaceae bacterium]|nr:hypothetical protein [Planctomycetaceae bacterium]